jgi:cytochrome c biogenesis protein CcdA
VLGPGQLLLSTVPHPGPRQESIIEVVVGAAMLVAGVTLWLRRTRRSEWTMPKFGSDDRSVAILGATIAAIELPTAFPYFTVIAAIVGSSLNLGLQVLLLIVFNVCFVAPLLAILAILTFAGDRAGQLLATAPARLQRNWRPLLAISLMVAGTFVLLLGAL